MVRTGGTRLLYRLALSRVPLLAEVAAENIRWNLDRPEPNDDELLSALMVYVSYLKSSMLRAPQRSSRFRGRLLVAIADRAGQPCCSTHIGSWPFCDKDC